MIANRWADGTVEHVGKSPCCGLECISTARTTPMIICCSMCGAALVVRRAGVRTLPDEVPGQPESLPNNINDYRRAEALLAPEPA